MTDREQPPRKREIDYLCNWGEHKEAPFVYRGPDKNATLPAEDYGIDVYNGHRVSHGMCRKHRDQFINGYKKSTKQPGYTPQYPKITLPDKHSEE